VFDNLKARALARAFQSLVDAVTPKITPIFEQARQLAPELVIDDASFCSRVVEPAWFAIVTMTGGVTSLIPNLHERFVAALLHARAELFVIDASARTVALVDNAAERLPQVLLEGLQKPVVTQ
jgi:hypothetical protein